MKLSLPSSHLMASSAPMRCKSIGCTRPVNTLIADYSILFDLPTRGICASQFLGFSLNLNRNLNLFRWGGRLRLRREPEEPKNRDAPAENFKLKRETNIKFCFTPPPRDGRSSLNGN